MPHQSNLALLGHGVTDVAGPLLAVKAHISQHRGQENDKTIPGSCCQGLAETGWLMATVFPTNGDSFFHFSLEAIQRQKSYPLCFCLFGWFGFLLREKNLRL